jgi:hypothetical protein
VPGGCPQARSIEVFNFNARIYRDEASLEGIWFWSMLALNKPPAYFSFVVEHHLFGKIAFIFKDHALSGNFVP